MIWSLMWSHMRRLILAGIVVWFVTAVGAYAGEAEYPLAEAVECTVRGGMPNALAKLDRGGEVRIAYIGGSITAAEGWRPQTTRWLQEQYPKAKIVEINAAIGGTGSDLGVFRFRRDGLEQKPDLVFVEFAVNDGEAPPEQIYRCMEGIVRQAWRQDATIDICFVYTLVDGMVPTLAGGRFPRAASAMEKIAGHYGIPSIHMGLEVVRLATGGQMILKADPKTDQEKAEMKGKMIFSADGVHPHAETGHRLYTEAVARSVQKMKGVGVAGAHGLPEAFVANNYEAAKTIPLGRAKLSGGWEKLPATHPLARSFGRYLPEMHAAKDAGQSVSFAFKGTYVGFFDLLGPDCGQLEGTLDGKTVTVLRFDPYCTYHRMGSFALGKDLGDAVHRVQVKVDARMPDKAAILAKRNEKMGDSRRFEGHTWYAGWIMIVGDMEGGE